MHLIVAGRGLPLRVHVTSGIVADCIQSLALIEGFSAECLVADRGYLPVEKLCSAKITLSSPVKKGLF